MNTEHITLLINYIEALFSKLRGDWSDNRWACREGWEAVGRLREEMGIPTEKPYRHSEGESDEAYYGRISKPIED